MRVSGLAAVVATIALAVAAAGCGGSNNSASETEQWADGMCSALVDWQNSVAAAGEKVSKGDLSKSTLQGAANGVSDANKQLRDDLDSLGKPPTETADKAKADLNQLTDDLQTNVEKIRDALGSAGNDVTAAITAVSGSVQAMSQDLQNTATQLKALESDETWSKAFKSSDSCQKLSG
jgi:small-conductance mechanosensitive channel